MPMSDKHLKLFHSCHIEESSLLCEDNLTRAFTQTLRLLSGSVRDKRRERIQDSVRRVLKRGDYEWRTVRLGADGRLAEAT